MESLWVAKTGLEAQQTRMTIVAQNLANVNTTGYKRSRAIFEDLLYQNLVQAGGLTSQQTEAPTGLNLGTGVRMVATDKQFAQGNIINTNNTFDMAIQGRGFFEILLPDGSQAYTRDGTFQRDSDGALVTSSGYALQPAITVPPAAAAVTIGVDGIVSAVLPGQADPVQVGTLQLTDFVNPAGLQPRGENLFIETVSSGPPQPGTPGLNGLGTLAQGALETSNVSVVEELVEHDRDAARVRDELARHREQRPDAANTSPTACRNPRDATNRTADLACAARCSRPARSRRRRPSTTSPWTFVRRRRSRRRDRDGRRRLRHRGQLRPVHGPAAPGP